MGEKQFELAVVFSAPAFRSTTSHMPMMPEPCERSISALPREDELCVRVDVPSGPAIPSIGDRQSSLAARTWVVAFWIGTHEVATIETRPTFSSVGGGDRAERPKDRPGRMTASRGSRCRPEEWIDVTCRCGIRLRAEAS